ncbi:hypothetical protein D187_005625 [Cystobacter fuscus DSM 2262]|uniref:Uncharacterized protein n=1 Tax=Cystobacter fuscus (strain ATCC 25194 / DSM 2262 / NBRC 100088 / M29) TaxID=1242864 RepID=S9PFR1_CYSF2|nr:hypothetical protein D187_005625 [Cystobacter fuscus DSM 2262]
MQPATNHAQVKEDARHERWHYHTRGTQRGLACYKAAP